ncbi:MAG: PQQ-binding-like beta-propeller repeat protein [Chloroflexota bacterium]
MTTKRLLLFSLLALTALMLSACGTQIPVNNWPGLAADGEQAYVASGSFIYAVNMKNGGEAWRYPASADSKLIFYANPVLTPDGQLLIGSAGQSHVFVSINPETGKDNWAAPFSKARGMWVASPLVMNERIYAPNMDGTLYVLDMNGSLVDSVYLGGSLWSAPVSDGTSIYVASLDHHLHVLDAASLEANKSIDLGAAIPGGVTVSADGVYLGTFGSKVEFVTATGDHRSLVNSEGWIWGAPALDGETLYFADLEGYVYSYDIVNRTQNWEGVKPDGPIAVSPLVVGDQIFVATESGSLVALDRDGKFTSFEVGGKVYTTPVVSNDLLLVAPYQADFALVALTPDGKQAWKFTPAK